MVPNCVLQAEVKPRLSELAPFITINLNVSIFQIGEGSGETVPAAIPRRRGLDDGGDVRARRGPLDGRVHERHRLRDEDRRGHRGQRHVKLNSSNVIMYLFVFFNEFHTEHLSQKKGRSTARSFNFRPFLLILLLLSMHSPSCPLAG